MDDVDRETFREAIRRWGEQAQVNQLHEELGELMVAINKLWRGDAKDHDIHVENLTEEIVDVQIMLDQLVLMTGIGEDEMEAERTIKIDRLRNRLGFAP